MNWDQEYRLLGEPPVKVGDVFVVDGISRRVVGIEPFAHSYRQFNALGIEVGYNTAQYRLDNLLPPTNMAYFINFIGIQAAGAASIAIRFEYPTTNSRFCIVADPRGIDSTIAANTLPIKFPMLMIDTNALIVNVVAPAPATLDAIWFYGYVVLWESEKGAAATVEIPHIFNQTGRNARSRGGYRATG